MSTDAVKKFFARIETDSDLATRVKTAGRPADVMVLAKSEGFLFSTEEYVAELHAMKTNLSDADLGNVAGGAGRVAPVGIKSIGTLSATAESECW